MNVKVTTGCTRMCVGVWECCYRTLTIIIYNGDSSHERVTPHDTNVLSWLGDHQCKEEGLVSLTDIIINNGDAEAFLGRSSWEDDWIIPPSVVFSI